MQSFINICEYKVMGGNVGKVGAKAFVPKKEHPAGEKVFVTTIRRMGDSIYVNVPMRMFAKIYKSYPIGSQLVFVVENDSIVLKHPA